MVEIGTFNTRDGDTPTGKATLRLGVQMETDASTGKQNPKRDEEGKILPAKLELSVPYPKWVARLLERLGAHETLKKIAEGEKNK